MATAKKNRTKSLVKKKTAAQGKKSTVRVTPPRLKKTSQSAAGSAPKKGGGGKKQSVKRTATKRTVSTRSAVKRSTVSKRKRVARKPVNKVLKKPAKSRRANRAKGYSKQDLQYFRDLIIEKIREANEELLSIEDRLVDSTSGEYTDEDSTYSMHMAEQGTDAMEREKAFLFASRERKFISHLEDALQRIASGNYGICIKCGDLIDKGRLEAVPNARMCVLCKNDSKRGELEPGTGIMERKKR